MPAGTPTGMPKGWDVAGTYMNGDAEIYRRPGCPLDVVRAAGYWVLSSGGRFLRGPHGTLRKFKSPASAARAADKETS